MEKFSIDIETFYKTDAGENPNVFSLSPVEKNQLTIGNRHPDAPTLAGPGALRGQVPSCPAHGPLDSASGLQAWQASDWLLSWEGRLESKPAWWEVGGVGEAGRVSLTPFP